MWKLHDGLEALTERWPSKARETLNEPFDGGPVIPFGTLVAKVNLWKRRRMNAVWTSLICFLVYSYDEGTLQEMGLFVSEELGDSIMDVMQAEVIFGRSVRTDDSTGHLERALQDLFYRNGYGLRGNFPQQPFVMVDKDLGKVGALTGPR